MSQQEKVMVMKLDIDKGDLSAKVNCKLEIQRVTIWHCEKKYGGILFQKGKIGLKKLSIRNNLGESDLDA